MVKKQIFIHFIVYIKTDDLYKDTAGDAETKRKN